MQRPDVVRGLVVILVSLAVAGVAVWAGDEVKVSVTLSASKDYLKVAEAPGTIAYDWVKAAPQAASGTILLGTNPTYLTLGSVSTYGYSYWRNVGSNASAEIAASGSTFSACVTVRTNGVALFETANPIALRVATAGGTNTTTLQYVVLDR